MNKRHKLFFTLVLIFSVLTLIRHFMPKRAPLDVAPPQNTIPEDKTTAPEINGRKVINPSNDVKKEDLKDLEITNTPSPHWQKGVEKALRHQGGSALKEIKIKKIDSFVWAQNGFGVNVESVQITVVNTKGEQTSFKALIDSQTGKILQSWDHPISDPINPRKGSGIKIDPRYHPE